MPEWFSDLARTRELVIVAGMGGGGSFPKAISWQEMAAWITVTGNKPTQWEIRTLRAMDSAYLLASNSKGSSGKKYQNLGEYCHGAEVEKCRRVFGEQLERVCSTCPE